MSSQKTTINPEQTPDGRTSVTGLQDIVTAMTGQPVLVVGDIMLDRFIYGDVHRISPESPVPVLTVQNETRMLGGAGNVLANLHSLGVKTHMLAVVGDDESAALVRAIVQDKGADPAGLIVAADRPTTEKTRFLAAHQQLLRTDYENAAPVPDDIAARVLEAASTLIPRMKAVILSDYGKGLLTDSLISTIIDKARAAGVPVLVDPKKADYSLYRGASVITPNRKELGEATQGMATRTDDDVVAAARAVIAQAGIETVLATRSQDGMSVIRRGDAAPVHLRTTALEVFDVSGAGDTVIATVAAALAVGADILQAAALANIAGGLVVAKVGTATVRARELLNALDDGRDLSLTAQGDGAAARVIMDHARDAKICDRVEAAEIVAKWRARNQSVGFTNGCFDILHPGHVSYLAQARARCDRLIVALNADESVRRLKGADRPVNNEDARALVMAALAVVDMVILFGDEAADDDKPLALIERLRPDIYFKGGDYKMSDLLEVPVVQGYGGRVELMPHYEGHSTTATIARVKRQGT